MFTGIVSGVGRIERVEPLGDDAGDPGAYGLRLTISAPAGYLDDAQPGDSVAVNGACMTLTRFDSAAALFWVDVSAASLAATAGLDVPGPVNLEKALRANDRLGGHLVSGHVDGVGTVTQFEQVGESWRLRVHAPRQLARYLAMKGSITVNGVSLTINQVEDDAEGCDFALNLIPHTLQHSTLGTITKGRRVNLEIDLVARYVERMLDRVTLCDG